MADRVINWEPDDEFWAAGKPNGAAELAKADELIRQLQNGNGGWPLPDVEVMRLRRRPPPELPLDVFGRWEPWIIATARAAACPPDYVAAPLLAAASAVIGNARWPAAYGWSEPPHLWCASVGDSGDGKSPGCDAIYRHVLPALERRMSEDFPDRLAEARAAIEVANAEREAWKGKVKTAVKDGRDPPPAPSDPGEEPLQPRLTFSDCTIEKVALLLARAAPKGLLMTRDELAGWLLGMKAYNDGARAFWLEAYGGRPYKVDRVKLATPIEIPRFAVAWHGGIQPARLDQVMREADDGLLSRFLWFWPDPVPFSITRVRPDVEEAVTAFDRLRFLDLQPSEAGVHPVMVQFDPPVVNRMEIFARALQAQKENAGGLMRSALGKSRGLALRLSLVLSYLDWCAIDGYDAPPAAIGEDAFERASRFVSDYAMPMAERVFGDAARSENDQKAATLARWIIKTRPTEIHVTQLKREVRLPGLFEAKSIHAACAVLVDADWLREPPPGKFQQRAKVAYAVNPRLGEALSLHPPSATVATIANYGGNADGTGLT